MRGTIGDTLERLVLLQIGAAAATRERVQEVVEDLIEQGRERYLPISAGLRDDKAAEAVLEHFRDEERREAFYTYFRELEELYEILSPDPFLRPFLEDYETLTRIYQLLRTAFEPGVGVDKPFLRKTEELVRRNTTTPWVQVPESGYELTPDVLRGLTEKDQPATVKVFNLLIAIRRLVEEKVDQMPYLLSIGERAEAIAEAFEQHLTDAQRALLELTGVVEDLERAEELRKRSDLSDEAFAARFFLEGRGVEGAEKIARESSGAFEDNPHWKESADQERRVRISLYKALKGSGAKDMVGVVDGLLNLLKRASS